MKTTRDRRCAARAMAAVEAVGRGIREAVPHHWFPESLFLGALVLAVALWNVKVLRPVDLSPDVKALGDRVVDVTPVQQQIAFYGSEEDEKGEDEVRPSLNIRPSIRVYANRPMVRLLNPDQLREWVKQGGRFLWSEKSLSYQVPASFELIAADGKQQYFRDGSK